MRRPRFIAEQARSARGPLGRAIAWIMERETARENLAAIDALGVADGQRVLDVGCGSGRSLAVLAARGPRVQVTGADASPLMCELALKRSRTSAGAERIAVVHARAERLPFADSAFERVLAVHVAYFWHDLGAALGELARVTARGARMALVMRSAANPRVASFPPEVYRFHALDELRAAAACAGFSVSVRGAESDGSPLLILAERGEA